MTETKTDCLATSKVSIPPRRIAILVLGMHRSGTSATTRVINLLGADLSSNLMPAAKGNNEKGFWESADASLLNDEILANACSNWRDWRIFNPDWIRSPAKQAFKVRALEILEQDFAESSLFVLKDSRICRLLPFWLDVVREFDTEPKCVLPIRNPFEIADSLRKRNGFSPPKSHVLWLRYVLDAEYESRGLERTFVTYEGLINDWRRTVAKLSDELNITWPRRSATAEVEIDSFLDRRLRHHAIGDESVFHHPELVEWVKETYAALHALHAHPESKNAQTRLDQIRKELDRASTALGAVLRSEEMARETLAERISEMEQAAKAREARIGMLTQATMAHEAPINGLRSRLSAEQDQKNDALKLKRQLLHRLDAIQTSASWQLAGPFRAAESRWPRLVRGIAAIPKVVWWALTLRLPQRLRIRRLAAELQETGQFDRIWYVENNPDIVLNGANPVLHWLVTGRFEGRDPSPSQSGGGQTQSREAHIVNVSAQEYAILRQDVASSGFWDENWYLSNYYSEYRDSEFFSKDNQTYSPLDYYLHEGWKRGHRPSRDFVIGNMANKQVNPVTYFLNFLRFESYHFDENVWIPSSSRIADYVEAKKKRKASKVVYTCIVNNYDLLMQPYYIDDVWDYVCFSDDEEAAGREIYGVWEIRKVERSTSDSDRDNRWHKMHPHVLFPDYEESIYIDGNINIISSYLFDEVERHDKDLLFPQHFNRTCVYDEIDILLHSHRTSQKNKSSLIAQRNLLEQEKFPHSYGLGENNILYRRHKNPRVIRLMEEWWAVLSKYSSRDQLGLAYVMWKQGWSIRKHMFVNSRISYKDFWMVKHAEEASKIDSITPAFATDNIAVVFSTNEGFALYLGVAIKSLIENSTEDNNYDIIVLQRDLGEQTINKLRSLCSGRRNISLRFVNMQRHLAQIPNDLLYVDGYVPPETYNKCMLTSILIGYERCVYLDSDIVVLDDIAKLHSISLNGKSIGASLNVANINAAYCNKEIKSENFRQYVKDKLGVLDYRRYFQAGVLVMDLNKLYTMDLLELCMSKLEHIRKPIFFDQCVFNSVFYNDVEFFSTAWNHVWYMQKYSYLKSSVPEEVYYDYAHGRVDPKIIHYASRDKPQNKPDWALSEYFWRYARKTSFFDEILKDCSEKLAENDYRLLIAKVEKCDEQDVKMLVHLHLFYYDQLDYMLGKLQNIGGCACDLFVTVPDNDSRVKNRILKQFNNANILVVPNIGYDIYPFSLVLSKVRLDEYDYILKIHTKNFREEGQDEVYSINVPGYQWRNELIDALLGSEDIFSRNLRLLQENKSAGCVAAKRFIFNVKKNNEEKVYSLDRWKSDYNIKEGEFYVGGTMFLARSYPFEKVKSMNLRAEDFQTGKLKTKDYKNLAHVLERLFGIIINNEGFEIVGV